MKTISSFEPGQILFGKLDAARVVGVSYNRLRQWFDAGDFLTLGQRVGGGTKPRIVFSHAELYSLALFKRAADAGIPRPVASMTIQHMLPDWGVPFQPAPVPFLALIDEGEETPKDCDRWALLRLGDKRYPDKLPEDEAKMQAEELKYLADYRVVVFFNIRKIKNDVDAIIRDDQGGRETT